MNDPGMVIRCDTPVCQHPATHLAITVYAGREQQTHMCEKHTATFRTNIGSVQWPPDLRMVMIVSLADIFTPDTVNAAATADAPAN